MSESAAPELSNIVDLDALPKSAKTVSLQAVESERMAIAKRLRIPAVKSLSGIVTVSASKLRIDVKGSLKARLVRECVASLDEFEQDVGEEFEIEFLRQPPAESVVADEEDWLDAPDVHEGALIDVGELLVQQLSLAMDPFPRKAGAPSLVDQFGAQHEESPLAAALEQAIKREQKQ